MGKIIRLLLMGIGGIAIVGGLLYLAGFRVVGPGGRPLLSGSNAGNAKHQPGWRRAGEQHAGAMGVPGSGQGKQMAQADQSGPGSGQGQGSGHKQRQGRGGNGQQGGGGQQGRQPGFGPTGGILLPAKVGTTAIPVVVGGQEKGSFVGNDLVDHVEDTVIATADGPRKGWAVAKTLKYLGIESYKEAVLIGPNGKRVVVSLQQLQDNQTIPLFTYNENGQLMVVSGPKVRGTNRGNITLEQVKQTVAGRTDLLNVSAIEKIEVKG